MADEHQQRGEFATPPRKFHRPSPIEIAIAPVQGSGIRVLMDKNDQDSFNSIKKTILTCKDRESAFFRAFKGFMHDDKVQVNGQKYGKFSYRWLKADSVAGMTPEILAGLFAACNQARFRPDEPYEGSNVRATVTVLAIDALPMGDFYSETDIVKHCTSTYERFKLWRTDAMSFQQENHFFWSDASHGNLAETIKRLKAKINSAPTIDGITF